MQFNYVPRLRLLCLAIKIQLKTEDQGRQLTKIFSTMNEAWCNYALRGMISKRKRH